MRVSRISGLLVAAGLTAIALAGCASGTDVPTDAEPNTSETASNAATPTDETTPEPGTSSETDAPSEPDDGWTIDGAAVGPFTLGADFDTAATDMGAEGWTVGCGTESPDDRILSGAADGVDWTVAAAFDEATGERSEVIGTIMFNGESGPSTADGLGLGSPLDEVMTAFPDAVPAEYGQGYTGYSVTDGENTTYWGTQSGDVVTSVVLTTQTTAPLEFCG